MKFSTPAAALLAVLALAACSDDDPTAPVPVTQKAIVAGDVCDGVSMPAGECEALVALYNGTDGPGWTDATNWGANTNPCTWYGVTCTEGDHGSVDLLVLHDNNLSGPIPTEIGDFPELRSLILSRNALTGPVPAQLADLTNAGVIRLSQNELTGPIPAQLGTLPKVTQLQLDWNQLTGPIPPELGSMPMLMFLSMGYNQLTGSVPASLAAPAAMRVLYVNDNQLTGELPAEFGAVDWLQLAVDDNELTGAVPLEVAGAVEAATICRFAPGNPALYLPDTPEYRAHDLDGDGLICDLGFTVVADAGTAAGEILGAIAGLQPPLNHGQARALAGKIERAMEKAEAGQYGVAIAMVDAFVSQVNDLVAEGVLTPAEAAPLLANADAMIADWEATL